MIDRIVFFLRSWLRLIRAVEALLIDAIAATAPWLAPIIPAWMTWSSMSTRLDFPPWVALVGALVVESLGLSAVHTSFILWDYNDSRRQIDQTAPVKVSILTAVFYLSVILTVNVLLDQSEPVHRLAKALLSSLSILAAVILAIRSQHARRLGQIEQDRAEKRAERQQRQLAAVNSATSATNRQLAGNLPAGDWRTLPPEDRALIASISTVEVMQRYSIPERTARHWRELARNNGFHTPSKGE